MPLPGLLASFADKAQSAIDASPLAGRIPNLAQSRPSSPDSAAQPSANEAAAQGGGGGHRSHALGTISHHLRTFGQQYSSNTPPVQKIITAEKGIAIALDSIARDSKAQSKELYTWGQTESDDLRDVTDRLAYLNFMHGSLVSAVSVKLDTARAPLKALRDAEATLMPRRNIRAGYQHQIERLEGDQQKGMEGKLKEMKDQLKKADHDDEGQEKEVELLKRKGVRESERAKWEALREYGEKLILLSQAATPIIAALPPIPPTAAQPYQGAQATATARASLQHAMDTYKPGQVVLATSVSAPDLARSDTRSFGESHASELSSIASHSPSLHAQPGLPITPPTVVTPLKDEHAHAHAPPAPAPTSPPPIDPASLNQSPATIPAHASPAPAAPAAGHPSPPSHTSAFPPGPTIAESGIPVSGGNGPASGRLRDLHGTTGGDAPGQSPAFGSAAAAVTAATAVAAVDAPTPKPAYETAEEEKRRLQREREAASSSAPAPAAPAAAASQTAHETAEEEKKRLEREERERILTQGGSGDASGKPPGPNDTDDAPPSYQPY